MKLSENQEKTKSIHKFRPLLSLLPLAATSFSLGGCLQATNRNLTCGSTEAAVLPSDDVKIITESGWIPTSFSRYAQNRDVSSLARISGLGAYFSYGKVQGEVAKDGAFAEGMPECTVHLSDAGFLKSYQEASKNNQVVSEADHRFLMWFSRGCLDYRKLSEGATPEGYLILHGMNRAQVIRARRFGWNPKILAALSDQAELEFKRADNESSRKNHFTPHMSDRMLVTLATPADTSQEPASLALVYDQLKHSNSDLLQKDLASLRVRDSRNHLALLDWIHQSESAAVLRVMHAMVKAGFNCASSTSNESCKRVKEDLMAESQALAHLYNLPNLTPETVLAHWEDRSLWASTTLEGKIQTLNQERSRHFRNQLNSVRAAALPDLQSQGANVLFSDTDHQFFFHTFADFRRIGGRTTGITKYMGLPIFHLFAVPEFHVTATGQSEQIKGSFALDLDSPGSANPVLHLKKPIEVAASDEGSMLSYRGFYPFANLRTEWVRFGGYPTRDKQAEPFQKEPTDSVYSRSPECTQIP